MTELRFGWKASKERLRALRLMARRRQQKRNNKWTETDSWPSCRRVLAPKHANNGMPRVASSEPQREFHAFQDTCDRLQVRTREVIRVLLDSADLFVLVSRNSWSLMVSTSLTGLLPAFKPEFRCDFSKNAAE
jgi:hypothetical protein